MHATTPVSATVCDLPKVSIGRLAMKTLQVLSLGAVLFACGGKQAEPVTPQQPVSDDSTRAPVVTSAGVQVAVADTPSSADVPIAERPKIVDAAKESYFKALDAFGKGELAEAKQFFLDTISKDPKAYQAHYSLGVVLERLGDAEALSRYRQAFTIVTDYEPAISAYGLLLARKGNASEADQFLSERSAKMPKSAAVAAALAEVKSMQRDTGGAQRLAQEALKLNPNYAPAMVTLARDHFRNRRLDLAKYALQGILDGFGPDNPPRDKTNVEARLIRSLILQEEGFRAAAIAELEAVLQRRPDIVDATVQLATYYLESGNASSALPLLERAVRYNNDNTVARLNLGDVHRLLGHPAEAKNEFDWVLAKDPTLIHVHYNMGLLFLFSNSFPGKTPLQQVDSAIASFEKYKELRGRSIDSRGSDVDQLILRAKAKKAMVEAESAAPPPEPEPVESSEPPASP